jgi:hypothetical protein
MFDRNPACVARSKAEHDRYTIDRKTETADCFR